MQTFSEPSVYQSSKCNFTHGTIGHLDPKQLPTKGKPWAALAGLDFIHKVDLILPEETFKLIQESLLKGPAPEYRRVIMTLGDILTGDFLKEYIKQGNIMMLSEGTIGVDNVFVLKSGNLKMFLDKETYERAGLVGKPHGVKGKRGLKPRWVVEIDLSAHAMWPGKKGFDRLIYACKNALSRPMTWLFCNLSSGSPDPDPLTPHAPVKFTSTAGITEDIFVKLPSRKPSPDMVASGDRDEYEEFATGIYEWLSLLRLESPRILASDDIDPFLSRYRVPGDTQDHRPASVCKISWQGFLSSSWARKTLVDVILALPAKTWFSFSATTFSSGMMTDASEFSFFRPPESSREYLAWEVKSHE
ncbi:ribonuclease P 40kDa subunit-domain-containing protein [Coniochaeta sp. 2T2.1]|nr:ribonuclease P 40kDa subunit-domain-containing protein [Coniochaeta sp. 2T2.1]